MALGVAELVQESELFVVGFVGLDQLGRQVVDNGEHGVDAAGSHLVLFGPVVVIAKAGLSQNDRATSADQAVAHLAAFVAGFDEFIAGLLEGIGRGGVLGWH